ncbi:MAG: BamA/TamA family outer membrane protein [Paludibacteraceae bacterium]|nr:BamA/TamA family outer membrane protein [Paludibacteraceae bacterium]
MSNNGFCHHEDDVRAAYGLWQTLLSILVVCVMAVLSSCSTTRYVRPTEYLLNDVDIKVDTHVMPMEELVYYLRQTPNSGIFGTYRLQLRIYNLSGRDTTKWTNRILRKAGEPPVIYSEELTRQTAENLRRLYVNKGYPQAEVVVDTTHKRQKIDVRYNVTAHQPYRIRSISSQVRDDTVRRYFNEDSLRFKLKEGDVFDLDNLELERERIVTHLRNKGFYYFTREYVFVEADTTVGNHQVDLLFRIRPVFRAREDGTYMPLPHHKRMRIGEVDILPWFLSSQITYRDTVSCGRYRYIYGRRRMLCPSSLYLRNFVFPGQYYSETATNRTSSLLSSLGVTRYANIAYRESNDSTLDCTISLTPTRVQSFSVEVEGTNTDGDIGAAMSGTYTHRNVFHGAEQFDFKTRLAYQPMGNLQDALSDRSLEIGGEASLTFPKVLFPFVTESMSRRIRAFSQISGSYNFQTTPWYDRTIAGAGFKYVWTTGSLNNERYTIDVMDLSYVYLPRVSDSFRETYLHSNSILRYSYEDHIILGLGFSFSRNNRRNALSNFFSYSGSVSTAGNLLSGICSVFGVEKKDGVWQISNIRFSQYAKGEFEYAYNQVLGEKTRLVWHGHVGVAFPYGNADVVPFEKRFYAGGANSVRGWSVRTLGPGIYRSRTSRTDFMQSGDVKLDVNLEYRFKIFWLFEGAAFVDGGNVWTIKDYDSQPGGLFEFDQFASQLAWAYGLGLRLDFDFFLVRLDLGSQLYDPSEQKTRRWRKPLRLDDMAFHLAIGYPF